MIVIVIAEQTKYSFTVDNELKRTSARDQSGINQKYGGVVITGGTFTGNKIVVSQMRGASGEQNFLSNPDTSKNAEQGLEKSNEQREGDINDPFASK